VRLPVVGSHVYRFLVATAAFPQTEELLYLSGTAANYVHLIYYLARYGSRAIFPESL
jgi:hypothetical protein